MAVVESWEDTPSFSDLARGVSNFLESSYNVAFMENTPPNKPDSWNITTCDITCVSLLVVVLPTLHFTLTKRVFMPLAIHYDIPEVNWKKFPHSGWKFTFHLCAFCYEWYLIVMSDKYQFFYKPETMWHGWSLDAFPPGDIYFIYVVQCSYYLYRTYATLFMERWRRDTSEMTFHHVLTFTLIFISHTSRCHNIGVLILFLHDICDILLEMAKLCSYFRIQGGKFKAWLDIMRNVTYACFTVMWFTTRIYWFPLKAVYSMAVHPLKLKLNIPYISVMSLLLWGLLMLHIYWSVFVLRIFYRIGSGQINQDPNEEEGMVEKMAEQLSCEDKSRKNILKNKYSTEFSSRKD